MLAIFDYNMMLAHSNPTFVQNQPHTHPQPCFAREAFGWLKVRFVYKIEILRRLYVGVAFGLGVGYSILSLSTLLVSRSTQITSTR